MMTVFDAIRDRVSARDAAEMYGLTFGRNGRALCPWHDDTRPDLTFYPDTGLCYCHACHSGGDAVALTARLFNLSQIEAARKVNSDFDLRLDIGKALSTDDVSEIQRRRIEKQRQQDDKRREWDMLCRVKHTAEAQIEAIADKADADRRDGVWDNPDFVKALGYRARAEYELDRVTAADKAVTAK